MLKLRTFFWAGNVKILPVGLVGGLDVHEGHGGSLALLILVMAEDFHALDSTKPGKLQKKIYERKCAVSTL